MNARRVLRHVLLAASGSAIILAFFLAFRGSAAVFQLSMGSAYAATIFLAGALSLGPVYALMRRKRPVSTNLRRDIAIWSGVFALLHTGAGLFVHFGGRIWPYFFDPAGGFAMPRTDLFGFANYSGLACILVMIGLVAISNDAAMRALGVDRWRKLQQVSPWVGALALAHAAAYQLLEQREFLLVAVGLTAAVIVLSLRLTRHVFSAR
jgi:sulfoxide reductase heme-binding subunit YedZ